jgi:hypothetical protein
VARDDISNKEPGSLPREPARRAACGGASAAPTRRSPHKQKFEKSATFVTGLSRWGRLKGQAQGLRPDGFKL